MLKKQIRDNKRMINNSCTTATTYPLQLFQDIEASKKYTLPSKEILNVIQAIIDSKSSRGRFVHPSLSSRHKHNNGATTSSSLFASATSTSSTVSSEVASDFSPKNTVFSRYHAPAVTILGNVTTGFDSQLLLIRTYLNKTTDKTKENMHTKIVNILSQIIHPDILEENIEKLSTTIYEISFINKFYSKLFASMYIELVTEFPRLSPTLHAKVEHFTSLKIFDKIAVSEPDASYEQSCCNNKNNDSIKAEITFLTNIMNLTLKQSDIEQVLSVLTNNLMNSKMSATERSKNDEWVEYVFILYKSLYSKSNDDYNRIKNKNDGSNYDKLFAISKCKTKECPGFSSKLIFKCLELIEI